MWCVGCGMRFEESGGWGIAILPAKRRIARRINAFGALSERDFCRWPASDRVQYNLA